MVKSLSKQGAWLLLVLLFASTWTFVSRNPEMFPIPSFPSAPQSPTPPTTTTGFQPPDGQCYIGAWMEDDGYEQVKQRILGWKAKAGKGTFLYGIWAYFNMDFAAAGGRFAVVERLANEGVIGGAIIGWCPLLSSTDAVTIGKVASGDYDNYIRAQAEKFKNFPYPLFIRFGAEMNGQWNPYPDTGVFINAWRRARGIFDSVGVKAEWIFSPVPYPSYPGRRPWQEYYPGDAYVEWVAPSCHDYTMRAWSTTAPAEQTFNQLMTPHFEFAIQHNKLFGFPETSFRDSYHSVNYGVPISYEVAFMKVFFDFLGKNNRAKMFVVYDYTTTLNTPELLTPYRQAITDTRYVGK